MTVPRAALLAKLVAAMLVCPALVGCEGKTSLDPRDLLFKHVQKPLPGTDQPYPNLASVPDGPPPAMPRQERISLEQKLAADNKSQTYKPDASKSPPVPAPPAPLPQGFIDAKKPVAVPGAKTAAEPAGPAKMAAGGKASPPAASAPAATAPMKAPAAAMPSPPEVAQMTRPSVPAPEFGALGRPQRVAVVLFASGSAEIDPAQVAELKPVVAMLRARGGTLQVVGYASRDRGGKEESAAAKIANFNLSLERANAVGRVLMRLGVKSDQLVLSAESDSASTQVIDGVSGPAANQRADIFIEY